MWVVYRYRFCMHIQVSIESIWKDFHILRYLKAISLTTLRPGNGNFRWNEELKHFTLVYLIRQLKYNGIKSSHFKDECKHGIINIMQIIFRCKWQNHPAFSYTHKRPPRHSNYGHTYPNKKVSSLTPKI